MSDRAAKASHAVKAQETKPPAGVASDPTELALWQCERYGHVEMACCSRCGAILSEDLGGLE